MYLIKLRVTLQIIELNAKIKIQKYSSNKEYKRSV